MSTSQVESKTLYEIALAISPRDTVEATATQALSAYIDALDCRAGAVLERVESEDGIVGYEQVVALPAESPDEMLQQALDRLSNAEDEQFRSSLPLVESSQGGTYVVLELPAFGVLVLCQGRQIDEGWPASLAPLNETLADTCVHVRQSQGGTAASARRRDGEATAAFTEDDGRQQTLEQLYQDAMEILPENDRERIAQRAVAAAPELSALPLAGVHLYDRGQEALVPAAVANRTDQPIGDVPKPYTDHETVVWEAYRTGEPVVIDNVADFEGSLPREDTPIRSAIVMPLGNHGVFIASAVEPEAFDSTDVEVLRLFSTLVEIAMNRSQREQGLKGIQEITRTALAAESHAEVAELAMQRVPELLDFPLSAVWRYDATADALRPIAWTEKANELFEEVPTFEGGGSLAWRAFEEQETYVVRNVAESEKVYNEDTPIGSEIVVPLGESGVIVTGSTRVESFSEPDQRLVETLAANIETVLRLVDRRQELDLLDQVLARILRHNIRNELNIIQGYASQIVDRGDEETSPLAETIVQQCHELQATAEHAREMRQIVRSREQRTAVSLRDTVEEAVSMAQFEHPEATITAEYRAEPQVIAHPDLMTAIEHLLDNSIKHNDEGAAEAVVEVTVDESTSQGRLTIQDNGPGIPRSEIEILDQHGESALEHGSGAGLWIIDRVVQYSGATIDYERTDDGTRVTIEFSLAE
jgi:signal transduction histidine kinase